MTAKHSPQDLNEIALENLRDLIATDGKLLPEWKSDLALLLKDGIPTDVTVLEKLAAVDVVDDKAAQT